MEERKCSEGDELECVEAMIAAKAAQRARVRCTCWERQAMAQ